jgi:hypothetical protein
MRHSDRLDPGMDEVLDRRAQVGLGEVAVVGTVTAHP